MKRHVTILGSTGSIGTQALEVIADHPDHFHVFALSAHRNAELLFQQCCRFRPRYAVLLDAKVGAQLSERLRHQDLKTEVLTGYSAISEVVSDSEVDTVVSAIVGAAGLAPTMAAIQAGKRVLLANKEALVMAGELMMSAVRRSQVELLPIDSEHNAILQCLPSNYRSGYGRPEGVESVLLTASGGPFGDMALESLQSVTPEAAVAHPNWSMGAKISVDSATMMNKGLEVIEARWLFDMAPSEIEVMVHPQSLMHAMVRYQDGSVLAHFAKPDMRVPIAYALSWPERITSGVDTLGLDALLTMSFSKPDACRYPCLKLAYQALQSGGTAPTLLNAANEMAVSAFLARKIAFPQIADVVDAVLSRLPTLAADSLEMILEADQKARDCALEVMQSALFEFKIGNHGAIDASYF